MTVRCGIAASFLMMAAGTAQAHIGFVMPDAFHNPVCGRIGAIASFSDAFPAPEVALLSDSFSIISEKGEQFRLEVAASDHAMTRLIAEFNHPGTYRLISGVRYGRAGRVAVTEEGYLRLAESDDSDSLKTLAAPVLTTRAVTVSETAVSCGARQEQIQQKTSGRLTIRPLSNYTADVSQIFEIQFDNAFSSVDEIRLAPAYGTESPNLVDKINERGLLDLGKLAPGPYTLLVRHIAPATADAGINLYSFSTALTFNIWEAAGLLD